MLEPILRPQAGIALNGLGTVLATASIFIPETVTTSGGTVPFFILMPPLAIALGIRTAALASAVHSGRWTMSWTPRVISWLGIGATCGLLGLSGSASAVAALGAFIAIDAAGGFVKRDPEDRVKPPSRVSLWARAKMPLLVTLYLGFVAAVHFLFSIYLPFGTLVTWSLIAFGFCVLLRFTLVGAKAPEAMLRAPDDHRIHEHREEAVQDPHRQRAEEILLRLRHQGDSAPFLRLVAEAATYADLPPKEADALVARIGSAFTRAGTRREQDVAAALDALDESLSPRNVREVTP